MEETKNTNEEVTVEAAEAVNEEPVKTFTQEEVNKLISERVSREQKKTEKLIQEKLDEAEKLRQMNAEQKATYEAEQKDRQIAELTAKLNRYGLEQEATSMFTEKNMIPGDRLLRAVVGENAEITQENVNAVIEFAENYKSAGINSLLKGSTPKTMTGNTRMTRQEIMAVTDDAERRRLISENIELFEQKENL